MIKTKLIMIVASIGLILVIGLITKLVYDDRSYYDTANELNEYLDTDGIKLMMSVEEVHDVFGKEDVFNEGFGGNFYEYTSKGITFSVSTDSDYDLHNKIGDLRINNPEYSVFGIAIGEDESKSIDILNSRGYKESNDNDSNTYVKGCVSIQVSMYENKVLGFRINVKDKNFDPDRIY